MLVIMVLGVSSIMVRSLGNVGIRIERDVKTAEALAQAKEALIGLSTIEDDVVNHHYPGSLPCPDTDNDGVSDAGGSTDCPQYIGRLPWKTLGLPDLRDAAGERLWYTLSRNVRHYASVRPLNSDTVGTLNVTGAYSENNLVAVVFSPGDLMSPQGRSNNAAPCATTGTSIKENLCAANYLEGSNGDPSPGGAPNVNYQNASTGLPFNDQLITISHDQLFSRVEKRVGNEIKNILNAYRAAWGAFPFAENFTDPSTSSYTGSLGNYRGLLPIGNAIMPTWGGIPSVSFSGAGSYNFCELRDGAAVGSRWRCMDISISPGETITIAATLDNVARGLWRPHNISNICEVRARNAAGTNVRTTSVLNDVTITNQLNPNGSATITFRARGKPGYSFLQRIELRDILAYTTDIKSNSDTGACPPGSSNAVIPSWLFNDPTDGNGWQQLAYYAISPGHAPGSSACTPLPGTPSCLTLNGGNGGNDKHAVVIMTGRAISGTHPSGALANYLEGQNATPADYIYENQSPSATFNDQVFPAP
jgi:hypothetical protein